jgi:hypothetical protein
MTNEQLHAAGNALAARGGHNKRVWVYLKHNASFYGEIISVNDAGVVHMTMVDTDDSESPLMIDIGAIQAIRSGEGFR